MHDDFSTSHRIRDIEVLRAVAVLFVVVHHAHGNLITQPLPLFDLFYNYFGLNVGVDIFFAISGFVITRQLVPALQDCKTRAQCMRASVAFWLRRAWRLLPSAWLWLAIILGATVFLNRSGAFGTVQANYEATIAGVLQFANFRLAHVFGRAEYGASFAYWSLSLEEQFYLLYPIIILCSGRRLVWLLALVAIGQLVLPRTDLSYVLRTDAVALGALLALWQRRSSYRAAEPRFMRNPILCWPIMSSLLVLIGLAGAVSLQLVPYRQSLISLLAAAIVFFASYGRGYAMPPKPFEALLLWIGARSYAIYLIHVPAFFLTRELFYRLAQHGYIGDANFWKAKALVFAVMTCALAEINYRWVESPGRRFGARLAARYTGRPNEFSALRVEAQPDNSTAR